MKILLSIFLLSSSLFGGNALAEDYSFEYENHTLSELSEEYERLQEYLDSYYKAREGNIRTLVTVETDFEIQNAIEHIKNAQTLIDDIHFRHASIKETADAIRAIPTPSPIQGPPPTPKNSISLSRISIYNAVSGQTDSSPCYGPKGINGHNFCAWPKSDNAIRLLAVSPDLRAWGNGWGSLNIGDRVSITGAKHSYCNGTFIVADATNSRYRKTADILSWRTTGLCKYGTLTIL